MMKAKCRIKYFNIEGVPGGSQERCADFWMYLGGCAALAACDQAICLARNYGFTDLYPYPAEDLKKQDYVDFAMIMKPYIHPRVNGVTRLSIFTKGFGKYLNKKDYEVEFETCSGHEDYGTALEFLKRGLDRNLPIAYLMLRHKDPKFHDLNWHWFSVTGYREAGGRIRIQYHTYGEKLEVDFEDLWKTGMYFRGGMISLKSIKKRLPESE